MCMSGTRKQTIHWFNSSSVSVEGYFLFSSLALIIIFAWMEPSGAAGIGFSRGLIFWSIQISILIPLLIATQHFISHHVALRTPYAPWIQTALSGVVAALVFVPLAYLLDLLFAIPDDASSIGILPGLLDEAAGVLVPVTVTWVALNAPWIFQLDFSQGPFEGASEKSPGDNQAPAVVNLSTSRFFQELRSRASGDLISISSELHYLRVTTSDAEVMFLYNMKDAVAEIPANSGVQIHRSHWVSRDHIKELTRIAGKSECILSNGKSLPISRRKYSEVREILVSTLLA